MATICVGRVVIDLTDSTACSVAMAMRSSKSLRTTPRDELPRVGDAKNFDTLPPRPFPPSSSAASLLLSSCSCFRRSNCSSNAKRYLMALSTWTDRVFRKSLSRTLLTDDMVEASVVRAKAASRRPLTSSSASFSSYARRANFPLVGDVKDTRCAFCAATSSMHCWSACSRTHAPSLFSRRRCSGAIDSIRLCRFLVFSPVLFLFAASSASSSDDSSSPSVESSSSETSLVNMG